MLLFKSNELYFRNVGFVATFVLLLKVVAQLPSFSEVRNQLMRHRSFRCTPVPDPFSIPDELRTTLRGRSANRDDTNFEEKFLMYSGQDGRLQIFCAKTRLCSG
jgi:hypothetical protein